MSEITITGGSAVGTSLQDLLMADEIEPGSEPSYQLAKTIFLYHPLGRKMVESPLNIAMSQSREITVSKAPERVKEQFLAEWDKLGVDRLIFNVKRQSRVYGIASVVMGAQGVPSDRPINPKELPNLSIFFSVMDPLNTAGSLVLSQEPNSADFQKPVTVTVSGQTYHPTRSCVVMNEEPIYIAYTTSAFGFVGRSVYQRALFPLKSFVQSMITDDMVTKKAGLLVAGLRMVSSAVDRLMDGIAGIKRAMLKSGQTGNVLVIDKDEKIETLNMQNADTAMTTARKNILENVAAADDMPAVLLNSETFAEGFGEGTEDAKRVSGYVDRFRKEMKPIYDWFEPIVMYKAWTPEFYETLQAEFPEYKNVPFLRAFYDWKNSYQAEWPSLIREPDSEKAQAEDVKVKGLIAAFEVFEPVFDPENKASLISTVLDNMNESKMLFPIPFQFDPDSFLAHIEAQKAVSEEQEEQEPVEPKAPAPFARAA